MDIRCPSCTTVYEFDESRLGPKGVNLRCSACGHVFKVVPAQEAKTTWQVRRVSTGEILQFDGLTTLQRWIIEQRVVREDQLSQSGREWKELGTIPELTSFFKVVDELKSSPTTDRDGTSPGLPSRRDGTQPPSAKVTTAQPSIPGSEPVEPRRPVLNLSAFTAPSNPGISPTPRPANDLFDDSDAAPAPQPPPRPPAIPRAAVAPPATPSQLSQPTPRQGPPPQVTTAPSARPAATVPRSVEVPATPPGSSPSQPRRLPAGLSQGQPPQRSAPTARSSQSLRRSPADSGVDFDTQDLAVVGVRKNTGLKLFAALVVLLVGAAAAIYFVDPTYFGLLGDAPADDADVVAGQDDPNAPNPNDADAGEIAQADAGETIPPENTDPEVAPGSGDGAPDGTEVAAVAPDAGTTDSDAEVAPTPDTSETPEGDEQEGQEEEEEDDEEEDEEEEEEDDDSSPSGYDDLMEAGYEALDDDDYTDALEYFSEAAEERSSSAEAQVAMARAFEGMGRDELAAIRYERATELNSRYIPAWMGLGDALRADGDTEGAIAAYERVLEISGSGRNADRARERLQELR